MNEETKRSCVDCGVYNCHTRDKEYPDFCLTTELTDEERAVVWKLYEEPENQKASVVSAQIESDFYLRYTRVQEIVAFAKRMGYHKIGIATCVGLIEESRIFARILRKNGFEVVGAVCKVGSFEKTKVGVPEEDTRITGPIMCNPIMQAKIMNREKTDFNVIVGLCVGHDSLFYKYADALCTTLVTKDRVMGHNPVAALYQAKAYYKRLSNEPIAAYPEDVNPQEPEASAR